MGKLILTERQYKRLKNILIENTINQNLLTEAAYTLDTSKYTLTTSDSTDVNGLEIKIIGGSTYKPTQKGNLSTQGEIEYKQSGKRTKTNITYVCSNNKFYADGKYYDAGSSDTTYKGFVDLCKYLKTNKKDSYGVQQTGGAVKGYVQQKVYKLKSKDGSKEITIPANTGYTGKKDKGGREGATFTLGPNSFGWFSCKSKVFMIDKTIYTDETGYLKNNISKAICVDVVTPTGDKKEKINPDVKSVGGGFNQSIPQEIDLYI